MTASLRGRAVRASCGAPAIAFAAIASCTVPATVLGASVALVNPGFESAKIGTRGDPEGWTGIQHAGDLSYTFRLDAEVRHRGARSLRVDSVGPEPFGAIYQQLPAAALRGKTLKLVAQLRTRDVVGSATGGGAVLTLQAMKAGALVAYDHMAASPVKGTTDWKRYEISLAVPRDADQVEIGAMLHGPGAMWMDDVELETD
jgi:hypothetical protein